METYENAHGGQCMVANPCESSRDNEKIIRLTFPAESAKSIFELKGHFSLFAPPLKLWGLVKKFIYKNDAWVGLQASDWKQVINRNRLTSYLGNFQLTEIVLFFREIKHALSACAKLRVGAVRQPHYGNEFAGSQREVHQ